MAVKQSSKLHVYDSLSRINWAFTSINRHLHRAERSGLFSIYKMNVLRGLARELQSHISHEVTDTMHEVEDDEWFRWGKVRIEWEHHLNPERPAFTVTQPENPIANGHANEDVPAEDVPDSKVN